MADPTVAATARLASAGEPTGGAPTADGRNLTSSSLGVNAGPLARPKGRSNAGRASRAPRVFAASGRAARGTPAGAACCADGGGGAANNLAKVTVPEIVAVEGPFPSPQPRASATSAPTHKVRTRVVTGRMRPPYSRWGCPTLAAGSAAARPNRTAAPGFMLCPMHTATRTHGFTESVIRGMTRLANEHGAINLAQGFPNFPAPEVPEEAAARAIRDDVNQYAITWGAKRLRDALARKYADWYGMTVDPETELTVTCGATEAMAAALMAIVDPGEEVIVFEPFYENYGHDAILCGAKPVFVPMAAGEGLDLDRLTAVFTPRTRAIVLCTPNTPTTHVFRRAELEAIAELCRRHDAYAVTDEIYEHIYYAGEHIPIATLDGMRERTVTVSGASKTYSITGWRIGTIVAPATVTDAIRKVHDFLTVGAPAPLQEAVAVGIE